MEEELTGAVGKKYLIPRSDLKCGILSQSRGYGTGEKVVFVNWSGQWIHQSLDLLLEGWLRPISFSFPKYARPGTR